MTSIGLREHFLQARCIGCNKKQTNIYLDLVCYHNYNTEMGRAIRIAGGGSGKRKIPL